MAKYYQGQIEIRKFKNFKWNDKIISLEEFPYIKEAYRAQWHYEQGEKSWYFLKSFDDMQRLIAELIGSELALFLNIPTVTYQVIPDPIIPKKRLVLASKNKMKPRERYYTLEDLNIIRMDYFHAIKKFSCYEDFIAAIAPMFHSKEAMIKFQKQIAAMIAIDIFTVQLDHDFDGNSYYEKQNDLTLSFLLDYELSLGGLERFDATQNYIHQTPFFNQQFLDSELPVFEESFPYLKESLDQLMKIPFDTFLEHIERKYNIQLANPIKNYTLKILNKRQNSLANFRQISEKQNNI